LLFSSACGRVSRKETSTHNQTQPATASNSDEGMINGPPIFAYLVFDPGRVSHKRTSRPIKAVAWRGPGAILGAQARFREIQVRLVHG
jgi:hypothetical protein